jgi:hypothetical protein
VREMLRTHKALDVNTENWGLKIRRWKSVSLERAVCRRRR